MGVQTWFQRPIKACFKVKGAGKFRKDVQASVKDSPYLRGRSCVSNQNLHSEIPGIALQRTAHTLFEGILHNVHSMLCAQVALRISA